MTNKLLSLIFLQLPYLITVRNANNCAVYGNRVLAQFAGKRFLRDVEGLSDFDAPWAENAHHYAAHDKNALQGLCYQQFEPCYTKQGYKVLLMHKVMLRQFATDEKLVLGIALEVTHPIILNTLRLIESQSPLAERNAMVVVDEPYLKTHFPKLNFTLKDIECIYYLMRGRSAKVSAYFVGCSAKNIEARIEKIRWKLDCYSKQMLLDKLFAMGFMAMILKTILEQRLGFHQHKAFDEVVG